jgi:hypothetical protein
MSEVWLRKSGDEEKKTRETFCSSERESELRKAKCIKMASRAGKSTGVEEATDVIWLWL